MPNENQPVTPAPDFSQVTEEDLQAARDRQAQLDQVNRDYDAGRISREGWETQMHALANRFLRTMTPRSLLADLLLKNINDINQVRDDATSKRNQARDLIDEIGYLKNDPEANRNRIVEIQMPLSTILSDLETAVPSLQRLLDLLPTIPAATAAALREAIEIDIEAARVVIGQAREALQPIPEPATPVTLPEAIDAIRDELDAAIRNALEKKRDLCGFALASLAKLYRERPETIPPEAWNQGINPFVQRSQFTRCQRPAPGTTIYWQNIPTPGQTPTTP